MRLRFWDATIGACAEPFTHSETFYAVKLRVMGKVNSMTNIRNPYPTYLINLDSRPDRLVKATSEASKIANKVNRIKAVDGSVQKYEDSGLLTNSQQACFDSHKLAYKEFLLTDSSHALILEDDLLVKSTKKLAQAFSHTNISEFDLIQFGYLKMGTRHRFDLALVNIESAIFKVISLVIRKFGFANSRFAHRLRIHRQLLSLPGFIHYDIRSGAHCYLISRSLAEFILNLNPPYYLPIDSFLGTLQYSDKFRVTRSRRNLVRQTNSPSSIKGMG
jgi:GR25 family glycosyltransferase involved in LPS biosynthesis